MLDRDELCNDYVKIDYKENFQLIEEIDPYKEIDMICAKLNRIKFSLLEQASLAGMGSVVESSVERPIIGTQALDTCYGILFYDRQAKKGLVGHGSPSGKVATLQEMIGKINDGNERVIECMIVPGFRNVDYGDIKGLNELVRALEEYCPSNIRFVSFPSNVTPEIKLHEPTLTYEFAFDTRNGKFVSNSIFFDELEVNPRFKSKSHGVFRK